MIIGNVENDNSVRYVPDKTRNHNLESEIENKSWTVSIGDEKLIRKVCGKWIKPYKELISINNNFVLTNTKKFVFC